MTRADRRAARTAALLFGGSTAKLPPAPELGRVTRDNLRRSTLWSAPLPVPVHIVWAEDIDTHEVYDLTLEAA